MKFVLWLVLGVLVVAWLLRGKKSLPPRAGRPARPDADNSEPMLQCAHCGIHIPASEAVLDAASTPFCSDAHRVQHRSD